jgi:hypothetical protein
LFFIYKIRNKQYRKCVHYLLYFKLSTIFCLFPKSTPLLTYSRATFEICSAPRGGRRVVYNLKQITLCLSKEIFHEVRNQFHDLFKTAWIMYFPCSRVSVGCSFYSRYIMKGNFIFQVMETGVFFRGRIKKRHARGVMG